MTKQLIIIQIFRYGIKHVSDDDYFFIINFDTQINISDLEM